MIISVCANAAVDVTYRVPGLRCGEVHRVDDVRARAGGKGTNVARVLHQLATEVTLCGFAGGASGAAIVEDLAASGITHRLSAIKSPSRRTVAVVAGDEATVFNERGPTVSESEWRSLLADVERAAVGARVVVLSGSLPPGAPRDGYAQLGALAHRLGATVIVDADGPVLQAALFAAPDVVKPNTAEAAALLGREVANREDARDAGRLLLRRGASAAVVSRGPAGLVAVRAGEAMEVTLPERVPGNPTGAGDALVAALARALCDGATWREALCDAAAVAAGAVAEPVAGSVDEVVAARLRPAIGLREF